MGKLLEWAENYKEPMVHRVSTSGGVPTITTEYQLYLLAQAIIEDATDLAYEPPTKARASTKPNKDKV